MQTPEPSPRWRGALFIDFDNVFISLFDQDRVAAEDFATDPERWLTWLAAQPGPDGPVRRDFLIRRCYLNPKVFSRYRAFFVRAGFEVVDCPALTTRGKNSADIRMVIDMLDALSHPTRFEEFVLLSGDADFTPLLLRLRAHDRRTLVVAAGYHTASAYEAACDQLVDPDAFLRALTTPPVRTDATASTGSPSMTATSPEAEGKADSVVDSWPIHEELSKSVQEMTATSATPLSLAAISGELQNRFGPVLRTSEWLGAKTFKALLRTLNLGRLQLTEGSPGYLLDPERHQSPVAVEGNGAFEFQTRHPKLFDLAQKSVG